MAIGRPVNQRNTGDAFAQPKGRSVGHAPRVAIGVAVVALGVAATVGQVLGFALLLFALTSAVLEAFP